MKKYNLICIINYAGFNREKMYIKQILFQLKRKLKCYRPVYLFHQNKKRYCFKDSRIKGKNK